MKKQLRGLGFVLAVGWLLGGCTIIHPPAYQGVSASSVSPGETISVSRNQNVYGIAQKYGVSMRQIIALNNLQPPFVLHDGQQLVLPAKDQDMAPSPVAAPAPLVDQAPIEQAPSAPMDGGGSPMGGGGSPNSISGGDVTSEPVEPLGPPLPHTPVDQSSTRPGGVGPGASAAPMPLSPLPPPQPMATTVMPETPAPVVAQPPATVANAKLANAAPVTSAMPQITAAPSVTSAAASVPSKVAFQWPLQGPIISGFGPKGQGMDNDGINIGAPAGAPVLAAGSGIVVYAGNEMKGFGNLVLIRHEGGWVTAYAHLDRMLVTKDTVVSQGDMLGTVGTSGGVTTPQLHFETRLNGKPVDPQSVVAKAS